jgi:hypothetical protein
MSEERSMSKKRTKRILVIDKKGNIEDILNEVHARGSNRDRSMNGDKDEKKTSAGADPKDVPEKNGSPEKKDLESQVKDEIKKAKDVVVGASEGSPEKEQKDKKVKFDEKQNTEHNVPKQQTETRETQQAGARETQDGQQGETGEKPFVPPVLPVSNISDETHIKEDRDARNIVAEGWAWKKRRIFACFWHQKYFVLTKNNLLRYHKADGRKAAKGNWDLKDAFGVEAYDLAEGHPHTHRLVLKFSDSQLMLGFDERKVRDHWRQAFDRAINTVKS